MSDEKIRKDVLTRIISQFTTQDSELVFREISRQPVKVDADAPFVINHSQATLFYKAYTYITRELTDPYLDGVRSWDPDNEYLVRISHEMIVRRLEDDLRILTNGLDVGFITALSGEKQEKRSVEAASIAIVPYTHFSSMDNSEVLLGFEEVNRRELQIPKAHAVRKQLDLAVGGSLAVCKAPGCHEYKTFGVITNQAAARYPQFKLNSYLSWSFCMPDSNGCEAVVLRYHRGSLMMPKIDLEEAHRDDLEDGIRELRINISEDELRYIAKVARAVAECKHGAVIILARETDIIAESQRLTAKKRGMQLSTPINMNQTNGEPNADVLSRLSSIDGAIMADFQGRCHAYGMILDGMVIEDGNPDRGSRFNSTKTYIENRVYDTTGNFDAEKPPFFGIIFSDDGMVNIRWGQKDGYLSKATAAGREGFLTDSKSYLTTAQAVC